MWLFAIVLAVLMLSTGRAAAAFDCLAYKPEGARGHWHAEVVAGKICWFGANWRSFLPKKPQAESSAASNKKGAEPKAVREPAAEAAPKPSAEPTPLPNETMEREPEDLPGLRQATPTEAAALINAISLEFEPAALAVPGPQQPTAPEDGVTEIVSIFTLVAMSVFVLVTIVYKRETRRTVKQLTC